MIPSRLHPQSCDPDLANQSNGSRGGAQEPPSQRERALGLLPERGGQSEPLSPRVANWVKESLELPAAALPP